jgi:hypothetical protein
VFAKIVKYVHNPVLSTLYWSFKAETLSKQLNILSCSQKREKMLGRTETESGRTETESDYGFPTYTSYL